MGVCLCVGVWVRGLRGQRVREEAEGSRRGGDTSIRYIRIYEYKICKVYRGV
jgi:hypothetical protein